MDFQEKFEFNSINCKISMVKILDLPFLLFFLGGFLNLGDKMNTNPHLLGGIFDFFSFDFGYWIFQVFLSILFIFQLFDPCGGVFSHNLDVILFIHSKRSFELLVGNNQS